MTRSTKSQRFRPMARRRKGASAVEFAVIAPLMLAIVIGAVDTGQLVNAWHKVENASREGARVASRNPTVNTSEVESAVESYLTEAFPRVSNAKVEAGVTVVVRDSDGNIVSGEALNGIETGNRLSVEVALDCDSVRWLKGLGIMYGQTVSTNTTMRRE